MTPHFCQATTPQTEPKQPNAFPLLRKHPGSTRTGSGTDPPLANLPWGAFGDQKGFWGMSGPCTQRHPLPNVTELKDQQAQVTTQKTQKKGGSRARFPQGSLSCSPGQLHIPKDGFGQGGLDPGQGIVWMLLTRCLQATIQQ